MILSHIVNGFMLGISLGGTCLITCGPVYAPYLMMRNIKPLKSILALLEISLGRLIAYAAVGALVGWLGMQFNPEHKEVVVAVGYAMVAAMLFMAAFGTDKKEHGCAVPKVSRFTDRPLVLGLVTGVNLCPPFLGAVVNAADLSGPLAGAIVFTAFFAGSTIWLLPVIFFGFLSSKKLMRMVAVWGSVIVGVWFAAQSAGMTFRIVKERLYEKPVAVSDDDRPVVSLFDGHHAYLLSDDTASIAPVMALFQARRTGPTFYCSDPAPVRGECFLFVNPAWLVNHAVADSLLKQDDRFVVILPEISTPIADSVYVQKLAGFLGEYSFIMTKKGGTLFRMGAHLEHDVH